MSQWQEQMKALFLLFVLVARAAPGVYGVHTPDCTTVDPADEEDCLEEIMHPELPVDTLSANRLLNGEDTSAYWLQLSREYIRKQAAHEPNVGVAKNIILFVGDGMGITTVTAARNLLGGEEQQLAFEKFPYTGLSKTYAVDTIVPDSACTATAFLCGTKANYGTIGVNGQVARGDCESLGDADDAHNHQVSSIAKWAMDAGKAAGVVTTTRLTDATPAALYAHTADRDWENDAALKADCGAATHLSDIADQLINGEVGSRLKVMLGGGRSQFIDSSIYTEGHRSDGKNLVADYLQKSPKNAYVATRAELLNANLDDHERLLGLFHNTDMDFHLEALEESAENAQPTLAEMTERAIEFMQNEQHGYFLLVEGGKIDVGHHETHARLALDETVELATAVELARNMTSEEDTLIVVTADHSHTFSVAGYQSRGSDLFGKALATAEDDISYLALSYANGPSFDAFYNTKKYVRYDPVEVLENILRDQFPATAPLAEETHSGEDVPVFASGPWAHLFTGVYEQNAIPHLMAYAACVGEGLKAC